MDLDNFRLESDIYNTLHGAVLDLDNFRLEYDIYNTQHGAELDLYIFRLKSDIYNTQHGAKSSVENIYRMSNMDTRVGDQNLYGP